MTEDEFDDFHHGLELKRVERAAQGIGVAGGPFRMSLRKGAFTFELTGCSFNACMVVASGRAANDFCDRYHLPSASRYATKMFTEQGAIYMARAWRAKMTYFYSTYLEQDDDMFVFTRDQIDSFIEDGSG